MEQAAPQGPSGDPYQVLGVGTSASQQDIGRAYRRAVQHAHPDTRPRDPTAAARFQALTAAYDLLRDPGRRAAYDRARPVEESSGQPPRPGQPAPASRWSGSPLLLRPPSGQPIWAGPVHVEPPPTAPAASEDGHSTAAEIDDPVVLPGPLPGRVWGWPW